MLLKSASTLCHLLNTLLSFLGHKGSCSLLPPFLHLGKQLYSFVRVAITKWHGWGGLNTRHLFSHSSQGWMFAIKVLAGLVSLFGLQMAVSKFTGHSLHLLVQFPTPHPTPAPLSFFFLFTQACEVPRLQIGATVTGLHHIHSHSHTRSEAHL